MYLNFQKEANANLGFFPPEQWSIKSIPASNLMPLPVRTKEKDEIAEESKGSRPKKSRGANWGERFADGR